MAVVRGSERWDVPPLPESLPADHVCRCRNCDSALEISPVSLSDGHWSVAEWCAVKPHPDNHVYVDGAEGHQCYEIMAGSPGWVKAYTQPIHMCHSCREQACAYRTDAATVELVIRPTAMNQAWHGPHVAAVGSGYHKKPNENPDW